MSIDAELGRLVRGGQLRLVIPVLPGKPCVRDLLVTRDVWDLVGDDATPPDKIVRTAARARAKIDYFITNGIFVFGLDPLNKSTTSLVARVAPPDSGVLDFRISDPKPALRIFGGLVKKDALLLLSYALRDGLKFNQEVQRCRSIWNSILPNHPPMIGQVHDDYFSNVIPG